MKIRFTEKYPHPTHPLRYFQEGEEVDIIPELGEKIVKEKAAEMVEEYKPPQGPNRNRKKIEGKWQQ